MLTGLTRKADINESGQYKVQKAKTVNLAIFFLQLQQYELYFLNIPGVCFLFVCLFYVSLYVCVSSL